MQEFTRHFHAMGTEVGLRLWHVDEQAARRALADTEQNFRQLESRLSRFLPDSELSQLNRAAGQPFVASTLLFELIELTLHWRHQTDGIFDPTILKALMAYGYDRSFESITTPVERRVLPAPDPSPAPAQIRLDRAKHSITLPPGVGLDLGGIAKGWTVQQAAQRLGQLGPTLVDAGGDIACVSVPPTGSAWHVGVSDPHLPGADLATLLLNNEAVATSSLAHRRWQYRGTSAHHLIDPRTGAPAKTDLISVTVIAPRLPDAEIYAKVALILGEKKGMAYLLAQPNVAALLVTNTGRQIPCGPFEGKAYVYSNEFANNFVNLV